MANLVPQISVTQNIPFQQLAQVTSVAAAAPGSAGLFGSSLFLHRLFLPGEMLLTEIDVAMGMSFSATNAGQGSYTRQMALLSLYTSVIGTSRTVFLSSLSSFSSSSSWTTGLNTSSPLSSLTQFQGGWTGSILQPMTFASSALQPGDYVVGQLFQFSLANSGVGISLFGGNAAISSALTAFSTAPTAVPVLSYTGTAARSIALGKITAGTSNAFTGTDQLTAIEQLTVFASTPTPAAVIASGGTTSMALAQTTLPQFSFIGTNSTTASAFAFMAGILGTTAIPTTTVALSSVTYSGSAAFVQPWFALIGE